MMMYDSAANLPLGDPEEKPFIPGEWAGREEIERHMDTLILSSSGWRKVFAPDGDGESRRTDLLALDREVAATAAEAFCTLLREEPPSSAPCIAIGIDTRPTGPVIADILLRVCTAEGIDVHYCFISAAPELMAYVRQTPELSGFIYVSASHNPIGHNGFKFGLSDGGVLGGRTAGKLINLFKILMLKQGHSARVREKANSVPPRRVSELYKSVSNTKRNALNAYLGFTSRVVTGSEDPAVQNFFFHMLTGKNRKNTLGILAELNGSARTLSIDRTVFEQAGLKVKIINGLPGQIVHRIVPEGESLHVCRTELEALYRNDPSYILGYVPDNDGDRGNIVYIDDNTGKGQILPAQEVFALAVLSELLFLLNSGRAPVQKTAIAVNGPTSMRIDRIAEKLGVQVVRAEVGEANVVECARDLREQGYTVRILGEGSNGGNITHPAAVRDPINTVFAIVKLLTLRSEPDRPGLFHTWCRESGQMSLYRDDFSLKDVLNTLPKFVTTSAYEDRAILRIRTKDQGILKARYEQVFLREWGKHKGYLKETFGITGWEEINYEGIREKRGMGGEFRSGTQNGGLKILFKDAEGKDKAYIWMRGSKTEPVFRILADAEGENPEKEAWLLEWQARMIKEADRN